MKKRGEREERMRVREMMEDDGKRRERERNEEEK